MRRLHRAIALAGLLALVLAPAAAAQHRAGPEHRPPAHRAFVFVGGYFYDIRFESFPWWTRAAYPFPYFPVYDTVADVRLRVTPKTAGVFVDGFYAGVVDDFNGFFERLTLTPGGHEIALYLDGYRTDIRRIYLGPGSTFTLDLALAPLAAGERSTLPQIAPPVPSPPPDTFLPPRTPSRWLTLPPREGDPLVAGATVSLRVQPADAEVRVDGDRWVTSVGGRYAIALTAGWHCVDVTKTGYQPSSLPILLREGEPLSFNITLTRAWQ